MKQLLKIIANPVMFVVGYVALMTPTYILPYMGSNSAMLNATGAAAGAGVYPLLLAHIAFLAGLVLVAWTRGSLVGKTWLPALPIAAALFDIIPVLNLIPLVPTMLHVATIILGVKEERTTVPTTPNSIGDAL